MDKAYIIVSYCYFDLFSLSLLRFFFPFTSCPLSYLACILYYVHFYSRHLPERDVRRENKSEQFTINYKQYMDMSLGTE